MHIKSSNINNKIIGLLKSEQLTTTDLRKHSSTMSFFVLEDENDFWGCIGLEQYDDVALLRSLCVHQKQRGKGYGKLLVRHVEDFAKSQHVESIFLLTEHAGKFFSNNGYSQISRKEAPKEIRETEQFSNLCPSSAKFMAKKIFH